MSDKTENDAPLEETDQRRRELLNLMRNAAISGPILLTLSSTPALAASGDASQSP